MCFLSVGDHDQVAGGKYTCEPENEKDEVIFPHPFGNILVCIKG